MGPDQATQNYNINYDTNIYWNSDGIHERIILHNWFRKNSADDKKAADKNWMFAFDITFITLVSSADKLCKQIGPRWCPKEYRAWSWSNLFDTQMVFLKFFFLKKLIWKNQQTRKKIMKNCPGCKELTIYFMGNPLTPLKYNVYENIMEIRAFALLEQMLHFP